MTDMESFSDLARERRSTRRFAPGELGQEEVVALLGAALQAPSSKNSRCWQFVAVDDEGLLQRLSRCKERGASFLADAALAVVVLADPLASDVWIEDASAAAMMLLLQAEDLGLGACWIQVRERFAPSGEPAGEYVREVLSIPLQLLVECIVAVGRKPDAACRPERELLWERVHLNGYGGSEDGGR